MADHIAIADVWCCESMCATRTCPPHEARPLHLLPIGRKLFWRCAVHYLDGTQGSTLDSTRLLVSQELYRETTLSRGGRPAWRMGRGHA